jgi:cytochrome c biogenesis protein CcdA
MGAEYMNILYALAAGVLSYLAYCILSLVSAWLVTRGVNKIQKGERK